MQILSDLNRPPVEKTAAAAQPAQQVDVNAARNALSASLNQLNQPREKVASESAVASLEKMASDLAAADEHRMHKEAQLYGAAVFDGFISRANQFAANAPTPGSHKTAAYNAYAEDAMIKEAAVSGYYDADWALDALTGAEKTAAYAEGVMIKEAAVSGYNDADWALGVLTGAEKTAAAQQADFMEGVYDGLEKVAALSNDCFERGFEHMQSLHAQLTQ
jgi:hypothetical protein